MTIGRIPSVEGGIQPTIFDAKADILTATAADTPARLAVGSNDQVLTADSSTATGLKWVAPSSVSSYTPTWTNLTVGNATQAWSYFQVGKFVQVRGYLTFGSTTSIAASPNSTISITLPVTSVNYTGQTVIGQSFFLDSGTASFYGLVQWQGTNEVRIFPYVDYTTAGGVATQSNASVNATSPITWTTNDAIRVQFTYEAA